MNTMLFDLGNVFIRIDPADSIRTFEKLSGQSYVRLEHFFSCSSVFKRYERGDIDSHEFFELSRLFLHLDLSVEQFKKLWQNIFSLDRCMVDFFQRIRTQYTCAVLSNTNPWHIEYCEKHYPFLTLFEHHFYSYLLGAAKPEKHIFEIVLDRLKTLPENICFIDDRPENIQAAKKLGFQTLQFRYCEQFIREWENRYGKLPGRQTVTSKNPEGNGIR
jgi:HAD superfamily hydrolase (TIGR01509 family)